MAIVFGKCVELCRFRREDFAVQAPPSTSVPCRQALAKGAGVTNRVKPRYGAQGIAFAEPGIALGRSPSGCMMVAAFIGGAEHGTPRNQACLGGEC